MQNQNKKKIPLIEFRNVRKTFGNKVVHDGLDFKVYEGETFCIIGGSGTGKSVALKLLLGLIPFDDGEVYFNGEPVSEMSESELNSFRQQVGMLFQGGALFDSLTVFENIAYPLEEKQEYSDEEIEKRVKEKLGLVGLSEDALDLLPADLSGGMIKRVGLARAVVGEPKLILYDEPTAGLDPINVTRIDELILNLKKKLKVASIVVTHNIPSVYRIADRVVFLMDKKVAFEGTVDELKVSQDRKIREFIEGRIEG